MKKIFLFLFVLLFLSSCFKDIDIYDPDKFDPKLSLTSIFYTGSHFDSYIYKSALPSTFSALNLITNAQVMIYKDGNLLGSALYYPITDSIGVYYLSDSVAENGHLYRIEVNAMGKTIWAEDSLPMSPEIDIRNLTLIDVNTFSIDSINSYINISEGNIELSFDRGIGENKYYALALYVNSEYQEGDSVLRARRWLNFENSDDFLSNTSIFNFIELPFDNEALGVMINPNLGGSGELSLRLSFSGSFETLDSTAVIIHILKIRLSENLYEFYQSYDLYQNSLYNPFVEPVNVKVNVEGGLGIFAGMSLVEDSVKVKL